MGIREMMHDPDAESEIFLKICLQKFGLEKEFIEVMSIDVMILENKYCREITMDVLCFYKQWFGLSFFLNLYSGFSVRLSCSETWQDASGQQINSFIFFPVFSIFWYIS